MPCIGQSTHWSDEPQFLHHLPLLPWPPSQAHRRLQPQLPNDHLHPLVGPERPPAIHRPAYRRQGRLGLRLCYPRDPIFRFRHRPGIQAVCRSFPVQPGPQARPPPLPRPFDQPGTLPGSSTSWGTFATCLFRRHVTNVPHGKSDSLNGNVSGSSLVPTTCGFGAPESLEIADFPCPPGQQEPNT
jgi:hypothetical protein